MSESTLKCASQKSDRTLTSEYCRTGFNDDLLGATGEPRIQHTTYEQLAPLAKYRSLNNGTASLGTFGNGVAVLLRTLLKLSWLLPGARFSRLRCERRAVGPGRRPQANILDYIFDATLDRMGNNRNEPSWWRSIVLTAEGDYMLPYSEFDPHFLRIPSIRDWLSDCYVRADLKVLAKERLLAEGTETRAVRERLAVSYSRYTSDDPAFATASIDTALLGLTAGALSTLSPSERIIVELMRETNHRINTASAEILGVLSRIDKMLPPRTAQPEKQCERIPARPNLSALLHPQL